MIPAPDTLKITEKYPIKCMGQWTHGQEKAKLSPQSKNGLNERK